MTISKTELLIIADDVTGAADSAARCRQAGLTAAIDLLPTAEMQPSQRHPATVLALSTDSRFLLPEIAAARVSEIVNKLVQRFAVVEATGHPIRWYKKIDSTLRGNIGAELAAMLPQVTRSGYKAQAIIAPAFPAQQRTLVDGYLRYAQLPTHALHLPTLLREQCDLSVTTISLSKVRSGVDALHQALLQAEAAAGTLIVVDAESEEDLACLLMAAERALPHALFCGSAGLVGLLALQLATQLDAQIATQRAPQRAIASNPEQVSSKESSIAERTKRRHPMLGVVGSGSIMAQQQVAYLREIAAVTVWEVDPNMPPAQLAQRLEESIRTVSDSEDRRAIVLHLPAPAAGVTLEGPLARQYAATLADVALAFIASHGVETLLLVGGDTAVHLLQRLGVRQLSVVEELLPGMPVTVGEDSQGREHRIILKAGNHGDVATLATLLQLS